MTMLSPAHAYENRPQTGGEELAIDGKRLIGTRCLRLVCIGFIAASLSTSVSQDALARLVNDVRQESCSESRSQDIAERGRLAMYCKISIDQFVHLAHLVQSSYQDDKEKIHEELERIFGYRQNYRFNLIISSLRAINKMDFTVNQLYSRFITIITRHEILVESLRKYHLSDTKAQTLREQAALALQVEDHNIDQARSLLTTALELTCKFSADENGAHCQGDPDTIRLLVDLAWLEEGALDFSTAALFYERASKTRPLEQRITRLRELSTAARLWSDYGEINGRRDAIEKAAGLYRSMLQLTSRDRWPGEWARLQINLGSTLKLLGQRGLERTSLQLAAEAFRASLDVVDQSGDRLFEPVARGELATTLQLLGKLGTDTESYRLAIKEFNEALRSVKRERRPLLWASIQNNLGATFWLLSKGTHNPELMNDAVQAFRETLTVWTRKDFPHHWALAQGNLGNAYREIGLNAADGSNLQLAVRAYKRSLDVLTKESRPKDWALVQNNLGIALWTLGKMVDQPALYEEATHALRGALEEFDPRTDLSEWIAAKHVLGVVRFEVALEQESTSLMEAAVIELRSALHWAKGGSLPLKRAMIQDLLGRGYWYLGFEDRDIHRLDQAKAAFSDAKRHRVDDA
ncbi:MAG: hypothetical protein ACR2RE_28545, partial [Geminicoccaceae bacterium]